MPPKKKQSQAAAASSALFQNEVACEPLDFTPFPTYPGVLRVYIMRKVALGGMMDGGDDRDRDLYFAPGPVSKLPAKLRVPGVKGSIQLQREPYAWTCLDGYFLGTPDGYTWDVYDHDDADHIVLWKRYAKSANQQFNITLDGNGSVSFHGAALQTHAVARLGGGIERGGPGPRRPYLAVEMAPSEEKEDEDDEDME